MLESATESSDPNLLRSNIPEYSFIGFAGAAPSTNTIALTVGPVTGLPYPESRPIRVLMSREECRSLGSPRFQHDGRTLAANWSATALARCHFDEQSCALGLKRLRAYRKEWDEDRGV